MGYGRATRSNRGMMVVCNSRRPTSTCEQHREREREKRLRTQFCLRKVYNYPAVSARRPEGKDEEQR